MAWSMSSSVTPCLRAEPWIVAFISVLRKDDCGRGSRRSSRQLCDQTRHGCCNCVPDLKHSTRGQLRWAAINGAMACGRSWAKLSMGPVGDHVEGGIWQQRCQAFADRDGADRIMVTPEEQRGGRDGFDRLGLVGSFIRDPLGGMGVGFPLLLAPVQSAEASYIDPAGARTIRRTLAGCRRASRIATTPPIDWATKSLGRSSAAAARATRSSNPRTDGSCGSSPAPGQFKRTFSQVCGSSSGVSGPQTSSNPDWFRRGPVTVRGVSRLRPPRAGVRARASECGGPRR